MKKPWQRGYIPPQKTAAPVELPKGWDRQTPGAWLVYVGNVAQYRVARRGYGRVEVIENQWSAPAGVLLATVGSLEAAVAFIACHEPDPSLSREQERQAVKAAMFSQRYSSGRLNQHQVQAQRGAIMMDEAARKLVEEFRGRWVHDEIIFDEASSMDFNQLEERINAQFATIFGQPSDPEQSAGRATRAVSSGLAPETERGVLPAATTEPRQASAPVGRQEPPNP